jgi:hypothetical protein
MQKKRLIGILIAVPALLLIPLIAMQYTDEVKWSLFDFVVAGILLAGVGFTFEFIMRKIKVTKFRIAACFGLLLVFLLIWIELAVGIFNTPFGGS